MENQSEASSEDLLRRANQLSVRLADRSPATETVREAEQIARALLSHVRAEAKDFDDFVRRVERSEEFPLHDSAQVAKTERALKVLYLRAVTLLETVEELNRAPANRS